MEVVLHGGRRGPPRRARRRAAGGRRDRRAVLDDAPGGRRRPARRRRTATVDYASPNAVNILPVAGPRARVVGTRGVDAAGRRRRDRPGARPRAARSRSRSRSAAASSSYRTLRSRSGAFVLVEDVTEARRHEQELKVKEATIREVHHRVKNNLQTIASLLRIQARRTGSRGGRARAVARRSSAIGSMAVVHEMLAASTEESVDFAEAAAHRRRHGAAEPRRRPRTRVAVDGRGLDRRGARVDRDVARARDRRARAQRDRARARRPGGGPRDASRCAGCPASCTSSCATTASACPRLRPGVVGEPRPGHRQDGRRGRPAWYARSRFGGRRGTTVTIRVPRRREERT